MNEAGGGKRGDGLEEGWLAVIGFIVTVID